MVGSLSPPLLSVTQAVLCSHGRKNIGAQRAERKPREHGADPFPPPTSQGCSCVGKPRPRPRVRPSSAASRAGRWQQRWWLEHPPCRALQPAAESPWSSCFPELFPCCFPPGLPPPARGRSWIPVPSSGSAGFVRGPGSRALRVSWGSGRAGPAGIPQEQRQGEGWECWGSRAAGAIPWEPLEHGRQRSEAGRGPAQLLPCWGSAVQLRAGRMGLAGHSLLPEHAASGCRGTAASGELLQHWGEVLGAHQGQQQLGGWSPGSFCVTLSVCPCRGVAPGGCGWEDTEGDSSACQLQSFNCRAAQIFPKRDPESAPPGKDTSGSWVPWPWL